jgi:hypothetical protein
MNVGIHISPGEACPRLPSCTHHRDLLPHPRSEISSPTLSMAGAHPMACPLPPSVSSALATLGCLCPRPHDTLFLSSTPTPDQSDVDLATVVPPMHGSFRPPCHAHESRQHASGSLPSPVVPRALVRESGEESVDSFRIGPSTLLGRGVALHVLLFNSLWRL